MPDAALPADLSGRTIGDFHVLRKIGQGGMGQVYLARQQSLKREVALKILKDDLKASANALNRFRAEAEAVARITHANIVQVYAVGEEAGVHYMALEFVDGRNLRDYLERKGPPDLPIALAIIRQVAAALQRAYELGLVHRDIKPENILVTRKAEVKVADFGLSRFFAGEGAGVNLTQSGVTLGTPLYMSPEQVRGDATDHRSDIYSFGVTCYHLLAGEPPFKGKTPFEVTIQHVQNQPPPLASLRPDLPADLCGMVHKMMAKRVEDRYQTARDVIRDVNKIREGLALGLGQAATGISYLGGMTAAIPATPVNGSTLSMPAMSKPWGSWIGYSFAALLLAGAGFGIAAAWPTSNRNPTAVTSPGLPVERPVERPISTRELDLKAKIENRGTKAEDLLAASIQLGLLYVQERRWADADRLVKEMETDRLPGPPRPAEIPLGMAAKFVRGVSLAHQDQPKESTAAFLDALTVAPKLRPEGGPLKGNRPNLTTAAAAQAFFLRHPDLSRAVAEAVTRNAENGSKESKLDWLTRPGTLVGGPKG